VHTIAAMARDIPVLHFLNRFWIGGAERQFVERLRAHPKGFAPVVACLERSGELLPQVRELGHEPIEFPLAGSLARANTAGQVARLAQLIRDRSVRIVHATDFNTNLLGLAAARLAGVKCVVSRVDLGHLREGFGAWHRRIEKLTSRGADLVCANAEAVRALCIRDEGCAPEQVAVVRNGIDLKRFDALAKQPLQSALPERDGPRIAVIGNLWPVKGHRVLLEAAALLIKRFPTARFLCAGEGPERAFLEQRLRELGLASNVLLLGHRLDVPALLAACDAACLCSSAEGLSNAIIEAMAARLPLVVTDVGGNSELVREADNGFLVAHGDARALADRLSILLESEERRRAMGARGRARVEAELAIEKMRDAYGALYRGLLEEKATRAAS
jgi:glycosyltransferase involved in cell wall biosynthesis